MVSISFKRYSQRHLETLFYIIVQVFVYFFEEAFPVEANEIDKIHLHGSFVKTVQRFVTVE